MKFDRAPILILGQVLYHDSEFAEEKKRCLLAGKLRVENSAIDRKLRLED